MSINDTQRELISGWCDGELSDDERAQVQSLMEADPEARAYAHDMSALSSLVAGMSTPQAPPGFWRDMHESVAHEIQGERRRYRRRATLAGLAAAAVLVLIALPTVFRSDNLPTEPATPGEGGLEQQVGPGGSLFDAEFSEPVETLPLVSKSIPVWGLTQEPSTASTSSPSTSTTTSTSAPTSGSSSP